MSDLFGGIDRSVGTGNGRFIGHVANGMGRDELVRRFKAGEFPELNPAIAANALALAGIPTTTRTDQDERK